MNLRTVKTIFAKELLDMRRDKRTLVLMIGVPLVLYPGLFLFASQAAIMQLDKIERIPSRVAVVSAPAMTWSDWLARFFGAEPKALGAGDSALVAWVASVPKTELVEFDDPEQALDEGSLDAIVVSVEGVAAALAEGRRVRVTVRYDQTEPKSTRAQKRLVNGLRKQRDGLLKKRLKAIDLSSDYITPLAIETKNVASPTKTTGALLGAVLPILLLVMLGLGAFYPAIDLTAGEKERGTFETLLSTPTSKMDLVAGKFLTVFFLSMCAGLLNLMSMALTVTFQLAQFSGHALLFAVSLPPQTVFVLFVVLVPLAFLISALMMAVAMFARNVKEAEYYITPFFCLIVFPAMLATIPGTKLSPVTQFVPIVNVTLLFKDLMTDPANLEAVFAVVLSTGVYAVLALLLATWVFQREELILSEERGIPLTLRRSLFAPRTAPMPGMALALFAFCLLLLFYIGSFLQSKRLFTGLVVTEWGLILLPTLLILWYVRIDLVQALNLKRPSLGELAGTVLIGGGWVFLVAQAGVWHNKVLPMPEELAQEMERLIQIDQVAFGLAGLLLVVAISPAVCEEVLFRGALLSGLRQKLPPWVAVLVVGTLFGLFHLSVYRIFLTALSGLVLTYLVLRSGSLLTGVVAHFMINSFGVLVATKSLPGPLLPLLDEDIIEKAGLPWWLLTSALLLFAAGIVVLESSARTRRTARND